MNKFLTRSFFLALLLFATTVDAKKINWEGMRQVRTGMTTTEVVKLVGKPLSISSIGGKLYYGWASANYFKGSAVITIEFVDGKVTAAPIVPEEVK